MKVIVPSQPQESVRAPKQVRHIKKTPKKAVPPKSKIPKRQHENAKHQISPCDTRVSETQSTVSSEAPSSPALSPKNINNRVDLHSVSDVFFYLNHIVKYSADSEYVFSRLVLKFMAASKKVKVESGHLFALAMFWIYAKTYECRQPKVELLVHNSPFSKAEVIEMESQILDALDFDLHVEIPAHLAAGSPRR